MPVALRQVKFPKRGKGVKGLTFTAMVFGIAKTTDIKDEDGKVIGEKFSHLDYSEVIKGVREAEVLKIIDAAKFDRIEVLMRGHDGMARDSQSGSTNLENVLILRLREDGARADIKDEKQRDIRLGAIARNILNDVREFQADLEETYAEKLARILKAFPLTPAEPETETDSDDTEDDE